MIKDYFYNWLGILGYSLQVNKLMYLKNKPTKHVKNHNTYSKVQNCLQSYTICGLFLFAFHL
jgi:hypothetical protein